MTDSNTSKGKIIEIGNLIEAILRILLALLVTALAIGVVVFGLTNATIVSSLPPAAQPWIELLNQIRSTKWVAPALLAGSFVALVGIYIACEVHKSKSKLNKARSSIIPKHCFAHARKTSEVQLNSLLNPQSISSFDKGEFYKNFRSYVS